MAGPPWRRAPAEQQEESMKSDLKIGFIGFGNMAQAMADGLIGKQTVQPAQMLACAHDWEKLQRTTGQRGMAPCRTAREVAEGADLVVIAVKPWLVAEVAGPLADVLRTKMTLSVASGWGFDEMESLLPGTPHWSVIPNTPIAVGEGIVIAEERHSLSAEQYAQVHGLLSSVALVEVLGPKQASAAGTVAGCGPAFASMFLEALGDGAVKHGLPRAAAYRLAAQMMAGTGQLYLKTGTHPGAMKDAVCSPGGTTIAGVAALERAGLRAALIDAVDAVEQRSAEVKKS